MNARKTLLTCNLGLFLLLAVVVAKLVLLPARLKQTLEPASLQAQDRPQEFEPKQVGAIDYQSLIASNLFGPLEKSQSDTEQPVTILSLEHLQLLGTITGPETVARAIIKNKTTKTSHIYKINDWIDDAQLIKVSRNEAILLRDRQHLKLERTSETSPSSTPSATNSVITQTTSPAAQPIPSGRNYFTEEIEVVLKAAAMTSASQTHQEQAGGLMLSGIDRFYSAQAAGFREGDIIRSINGHEILSKQQMFQVLQKAKTQSSIDIEIVREGQTLLLSFEQD